MRHVFLCLFIILGANIAAATQSIITIEVNQSGDAAWTMEKIIPFEKESDFSEWENSIKAAQNMSTYRNITDYENIILFFKNSAANFSNRSMEVEDYTITYDARKTLSNGQGIVRYSFKWKNFSYNESEKIYIGDAFPPKLVLLSSDTQLKIKIPDNYTVLNSTPGYDKNDGNYYIWDGALYNNFSSAGPFVIISSRNATSNTTALTLTQRINEIIIEKWYYAVIALLTIIMLSVAFYRFLKKERSEKISATNIEFYEDMVTQLPKEMLNEIPEVVTKIVQSIQNQYGSESIEELEKAAREQRLKNIGIDTSIPLSELAKQDIEDEEMIKQFLLRSGGQAYQTDIVEQSGLSKSKISMVLSKMKNEGMIIKIRKGKENLIRLVEESKSNQGS